MQEVCSIEEQKLIAARIAASNVAFRKLGKRAQRVAIAEDVLAQLATGKIQAQSGCYIDTVFKDKLNGDEQLQSALLQNQVESCQVCGLGSLLVSTIRLANKVTFGQLSGSGKSIRLGSNGSTVREHLSPFFSAKQLNEIEQAFERWYPGRDDDQCGYAGTGEAGNFARTIRSLSVRLRLIMENIVANNGTFKHKIRPVAQQVPVYSTPGFRSSL